MCDNERFHYTQKIEPESHTIESHFHVDNLFSFNVAANVANNSDTTTSKLTKQSKKRLH